MPTIVDDQPYRRALVRAHRVQVDPDLRDTRVDLDRRYVWHALEQRDIDVVARARAEDQDLLRSAAVVKLAVILVGEAELGRHRLGDGLEGRIGGQEVDRLLMKARIYPDGNAARVGAVLDKVVGAPVPRVRGVGKTDKKQRGHRVREANLEPIAEYERPGQSRQRDQ